MNNEWCTPDDLYQKLNEEFKFEFDCCANETNAKCPNWSNWIQEFVPTVEVNEYQSYWMNPPYSRDKIYSCMSSAVVLSEFEKTVVCLVRFDPSAKWFQDLVDGIAKEVRMLDRRVKFIGAPSAYNFPCCVIVYDGYQHDATEYYIWGWK